MQNELIYTASKLFPTFEHWQSFQELANSRDAIMESWFIDATSKIRRHFIETLPPEWDCEPWGNPNRDTRWFLRDFGPDSLTVCYSYYYRLDLKLHNSQNFSAPLITQSLKKGDYQPIYRAFDRIDIRFNWGSELIEQSNFKFNIATDGNLSPLDLAWHAFHRMDQFVDQAVAKIERFTNNPEVSDLIRRLNQAAQDEARSQKVG